MRLVHVQRAEDTKHWVGADEKHCPCKPVEEAVRVTKAHRLVEGRKDFCLGRGHVIVAWSNDGSPYYICERCYAELEVESV